MEYTLRSSVNEITQGIQKIVKGEIHLAIGEAKYTAKKVAKYSTSLLVAGALGLIAGVFLLAFVFVGLAQILGGNFWLSALILTVAFGAVAAVIGLSAVKKLKDTDYKLPVTRESLREQKDTLPPPLRSVVNQVEAKQHYKKIRKEHEPKKTPRDEMRDAQFEVAEGHEMIRSATLSFTEIGKDVVEMGRNIAALNPEVTRTVRQVAPVAGVAVPGIALGYLVSKKYRERKMRNSLIHTNTVVPPQTLHQPPHTDQLH